MKTFLRLLLFAALWVPMGAQAQTSYLTVANGTESNSYVPVYGFYADAYLRCQTIYPASMLTSMTGENILGLTYYLSTSAAAAWTGTFEVKMMEVSDTTLSAFLPDSIATTVFTGTLDGTGSTMDIEFDAPYAYQGGNLLIEVNLITIGNYKSASFTGISTPSASWQGYNYSSWNEITGSTQQFIPKTTFLYGAAPTCFKVKDLYVSDVAPRSITLQWTDTTNTYATYSIYDLTDSVAEFIGTTSVNDTTYTINNLTPNTTYTFGVKTNCGSEETDYSMVTYTTLISCPAPTNLDVILTPGNGAVATLNWHEFGTATAWQIMLDDDTTNYINVYDTTYDFTGLTSEQVYTAKVRAICDVDDMSAWSTVITFQPTTKTVIGSGSSTISYLPTQTYYKYSMTQQIYTAAEIGEEEGAILSIDFYSTDACSRNLDIYMVSTAKDSFATTTDWITVNSSDLVYSGSVSFVADAWNTITLDNPFIYDGVNNVAIIIDDNTGSYTYSSAPFLAFDADFKGIRVASDYTDYDPTNPTSYTGTVTMVKNQIRLAFGEAPNCLPVTGLTVSEVTSTSVTLTWNESNYHKIYFVEGDSLVEAPVVTYLNNTVYLDGLTPSTTYTFGVTTLCEDGVESAVRTVTATTLFDCAGGSCQITITGNDTWGDGWADDEGIDFSYIYIIQNDNAIGAFTVPSGTSYTESFPVCANAPVSFIWISNSDYDNEASFTISDGGNAIVYSIGSASMLTSDSVFFTLTNACPSCIPPVVTVDNTDETSVTISWTDSAASYDVYNGTTFVANVTTNTYTFNGLTPATIYTFGVQAICSATDSSAMTTVTAMTACSDITNYPYTEGFENGLGCWTTVNGSSDGMPWSIMSNSSYAHSGTNAAASFSYYNYNAIHPNAWLISPKFVLPTVAAGDSITLSWWQKVNGYYPTEPYDVMISTTTNDTASFTTTLLAINPDSTSDYVQKSVNLATYAGQQVYIAFHHHGSYDQNYLLIDDIALNEGGILVPDPDTLTVTFAIEDATMGTINPVPGTYTYITGDTVTFEATPATGFEFQEWHVYSGTEYIGYITNNPATFPAANLMTYANEMTITAVFDTAFVPEPDTLVVNIAVNDATMGTTNPVPGTYNYLSGDTILITPTAATGYQFLGWTLSFVDEYGDTANYTGPATYNPMAELADDWMWASPITITALFGVPDTLTVIMAVNDSTMGTTNPLPGAHNYFTGDYVTIEATPADGYEFVEWQYSFMADDSIVTYTTTYNPAGFNANVFMEVSPVTFTAIFEPAPEPDTLVVTLAVDSTMGSITPAAGTYYLTSGDSLVVTATPATGYNFTGWEYSYTYNGTVNTYTVLNSSLSTVTIDADYWMEVSPVTFAPIFEAEPVSVACSGTSCTLTVNATDEWGDGWNSGALRMYQNDTLIATVMMTDGDTMTYTTTVCNDYPISLTWSSGEYDSEVSFTITNAAGTMVMNVTDGSELREGIFATIDNFCTTPVVNYILDTLTVTTAVNDATMGSITPAPATYTYVTVDTVSFSAVANTGYEFQYWLVTGATAIDTIGYIHAASFNIPASYLMSFANVMTLTAIFEPFVADTLMVTLAVDDATMGSITPAPGTYTIVEGDSMIITATPATGYAFIGWEYSYSYNGSIRSDVLYGESWNPFTIVADSWIGAENLTFTALFGTIDTLTVTVAVNDTTMGTTYPAPGTYQYFTGENAVFEAIAEDGYSFYRWEVSYMGEDGIETLTTTYNPVQINVAGWVDFSPVSFTAIFGPESGEEMNVTFAVNDPTMGTTDPAPGSYSYYSGDTIYAEAIPESGYHFMYWLWEYMGYTDTITYSSFYMPADYPMSYEIYDMTLTAVFEPGDSDPVAVTFAVNDTTMGTINPAPGDYVYHVGEHIIATAIPNQGYQLVAWTIDYQSDSMSFGGDTLAREDEDFDLTVDFGSIPQILADYDITVVITAIFEYTGVGIDDVKTSDYTVYSVGDRIVVKGVESKPVFFYDVNGRTLRSETKANETIEFTVSTTGVYFVKVGNDPAKRVVVVR